jgi:enoyl-CoA hydratase/carnithine racemase
MTVNVPLIAAVNGMAIGVGLTMLLHCDLVYVEPSAVLSAPFVALGLVPEAASSLILPRVVGERRATEILLAGRKINGTEAAEWGLANDVASPVQKVAREAAYSLADQPPQAVRTTKALLRSNELTIAGRMAEEMVRFAEALGGAEFAEVMAARSEKRPPVF